MKISLYQGVNWFLRFSIVGNIIIFMFKLYSLNRNLSWNFPSSIINDLSGVKMRSFQNHSALESNLVWFLTSREVVYILKVNFDISSRVCTMHSCCACEQWSKQYWISSRREHIAVLMQFRDDNRIGFERSNGFILKVFLCIAQDLTCKYLFFVVPTYCGWN